MTKLRTIAQRALANYVRPIRASADRAFALRAAIFVAILAVLALTTVKMQASWTAQPAYPQAGPTPTSPSASDGIAPTPQPPPIEDQPKGPLEPVTASDLVPFLMGEKEQSGAASRASLVRTDPTCSTLATVSGSLKSTDPLMKGRLFRDEFSVSGCLAPKTVPTLVEPELTKFHYRSYLYSNARAVDTCYTVEVSNISDCERNLFVATYLNGFDPTNPQQNYLADIGGSPANGGTQSYSFFVPAETDFVVVANDVNPALGCGAYTLKVTRCDCYAQTYTRTIKDPAQTFPDRLERDGKGGSCTLPDTYPGIFNDGEDAYYYYDELKLTNPLDQPACLAVKLTNLCHPFAPFTTAYLNSYDKTKPSQYYLADSGSSPVPEDENPPEEGEEPFVLFSFNVPAKKDFVLVTNSVTKRTACSSYQVDILNCSYQACIPAISK